jgi:hypothetical protein
MESEDVRRLFRFIDWIMELPESLKGLFQQEMDAFHEEKQMPFLDYFDRVGMQKGLLQGIESLLRVRFGAEGLELMPELREIRDHVLLGKVLKRIETADSPAAVRRVWTRKRRPKVAESESE